ncbi:DNA topoisomerase I [Planctomycetaceae bacterium SCGC AG-212-F19]|nr:DNA topoisomerase I [Planctomycetaceae bacterium SCGC AG-212-F19]
MLRQEAESLGHPAASAKAAGLRYVSDILPGIARLRTGKGFSYIDTAGKRIGQASVLERINNLAIPPAWIKVWICADPDGHLQAHGRDARDRKQYRYHPRWRAIRDETKYHRMIAFGHALPRIRAGVERDLALPDLPRQKVLATVVTLLEATLIRVGNAESARQNGSFGLTTMRRRHVKVAGASIHFRFRGKSGIQHSIDVTNKRLAQIVKQCQDLPGQELFQYLDMVGACHTIDSADVNHYLEEMSGQAFTAKDFRTFVGTVLAARALREFEAFDSQTQAKQNVVRAIELVAKRLGNTKTVCRKCYIHPAIIDAYLAGSLVHTLRQRAEQELTQALDQLKPEEAAVLAFLQQWLKRETEPRSADSESQLQSRPPGAR